MQAHIYPSNNETMSSSFQRCFCERVGGKGIRLHFRGDEIEVGDTRIGEKV